ncbi:unnamed protein product [Protopolystoma xenopodis]|uniref:Secreted protein n=1 Tax=Protopolystoma xenopodis TaxID=117903 RepID=A0A3S5CR15_9PLAT|nr:unnamed protein product [Protopolystoma xenopodis]
MERCRRRIKLAVIVLLRRMSTLLPYRLCRDADVRHIRLSLETALEASRSGLDRLSLELVLFHASCDVKVGGLTRPSLIGPIAGLGVCLAQL